MSVTTVGSVIAAVERHYPVEHAEVWDQIGLSVGNSDQPLSKILLAVDITQAVLDEAKELGAQLVIAHHPLDLPEVPEIVTQEHIMRIIEFAIKNKISLY